MPFAKRSLLPYGNEKFAFIGRSRFPRGLSRHAELWSVTMHAEYKVCYFLGFSWKWCLFQGDLINFKASPWNSSDCPRIFQGLVLEMSFYDFLKALLICFIPFSTLDFYLVFSKGLIVFHKVLCLVQRVVHFSPEIFMRWRVNTVVLYVAWIEWSIRTAPLIEREVISQRKMMMSLNFRPWWKPGGKVTPLIKL